MKKSELEILVSELESKIRNIREEKDSYKSRYETLLNSLNDRIEDAKYEDFKNQNGKFLDRFMKEWVREHVSVDINGDDCPNYVDVILKIDDETVSTNTGSISVSGIVRESYY